MMWITARGLGGGAAPSTNGAITRKIGASAPALPTREEIVAHRRRARRARLEQAPRRLLLLRGRRRAASGSTRMTMRPGRRSRGHYDPPPPPPPPGAAHGHLSLPSATNTALAGNGRSTAAAFPLDQGSSKAFCQADPSCEGGPWMGAAAIFCQGWVATA